MSFATVCAGSFTALYLVWHPAAVGSSLLDTLLAPLPYVAGILSSCGLGWLLCYATRPWRIEFPRSIATVGQLSEWIVVHVPDVVKAQPGAWSREQVASMVREIVIHVLCCEKKYRQDAHFVNDLGLDS
jgi:hypothetical protein